MNNLYFFNQYGYDVKELETKLDQVTTGRTQINLAFHSYNLGDMTSMISEMEQVATNVEDHLRIITKIENRKAFEKKLYSIHHSIFSCFLLYYCLCTKNHYIQSRNKIEHDI
jgi:hypothetical protein